MGAAFAQSELDKVSRSGRLKHPVISDLLKSTEDSYVSWKQNTAYPDRLSLD